MTHEEMYEKLKEIDIVICNMITERNNIEETNDLLMYMLEIAHENLKYLHREKKNDDNKRTKRKNQRPS